ASRKFGALSVVAGAFYYHDTSYSWSNLNPPLNPDGSLVKDGVGLVQNGADIRTRAFAGFGEVTWDVSDRLHLIAGMRYSVDIKGVPTLLPTLPPTCRHHAGGHPACQHGSTLAILPISTPPTARV